MKTKKEPSSKKKPLDKKAIERGDEPISIVGHLSEFRSRVLTVVIVVILFTMIPFFAFGEKMVSLVSWPYYKVLASHPLNVFSPFEGFMLQLKSSLLIGIFASIPVIVYEIWSFIRPAIDRDKQVFIRNSLIAAIFLFYAGAALTFLFLTPFTLQTLMGFVPQNMTITLNASTYLHFIIFFCSAMGAVCEMPLVIMILAKLGIVSAGFLSSKRKFAIIGIWIVAAVITPTADILTQSIVAIPLMLLFEISIIIAKIMEISSSNKKNKSIIRKK